MQSQAAAGSITAASQQPASQHHMQLHACIGLPWHGILCELLAGAQHDFNMTQARDQAEDYLPIG